MKTTLFRRSRGYTLVELLVVLTIISVLSAVTVPTLVKMGAFSQDYVSDTARSMYGLLRAARTHAATQRVDTAVFYIIRAERDSRDAAYATNFGDQYAITGAGMARKMTLAEVRRVYNAPDISALDPPALRSFLLVEEDKGRLRSFPENTAIVGMVQGLGLPDADVQIQAEREQLLFAQNSTMEQGLFFIDVYQYDEATDTYDLLTPIYPDVPPSLAAGGMSTDIVYNVDADQPRFPAHVFKPSGEVVGEGQPERPRLRLLVAPSPAADPEERFLDPEMDDVDENQDGYPVTPAGLVAIDINQSSGRIKLVSDLAEYYDPAQAG